MAAITSLSEAAIIALINAGGWPTNFPLTSGNLAALNSQVAVDVSLASNVTLSLKNTGSAAMAAGVFAFEGSLDSTDGIDGTWFSVAAARSDTSNVVETGRPVSSLAAGAAQAYAWELSVNALKWFRVRTSTAVTASSIATWAIARGAYATEPAPTIQSHGITGTVTTTPATAGTAYALVTANSVNASANKAGTGGSVYEISCFNTSASSLYLKFYNKNGVPAPATDSALLVAIIAVPAGTFVNLEFGAIGKKFTAGIGLATTALVAATDATAVSAGSIISYTYI